MMKNLKLDFPDVVCDFAVEAVGCFRDKPSRAIPKLLKNMRKQIDWYHMGDTVVNCAKLVQENGYKVSIHYSTTRILLGQRRNSLASRERELLR